jgi:sterol desaturase/sphingolipid hydroxylase (fatty acid hydroxylase superfamily)
MDPEIVEGPVGMIAGALFVLLLVYTLIEVLVLHFHYRRLGLKESRTAFLGLSSTAITNALIGRLGAPFNVGIAAGLAAALSPIDSFGRSFGAWIFGWLVYEFWYWFQHWAAHKVRLLWCIHSPHHAPGSLYMLIGTNHHFVEGVFYLPFFAGFMPALMGVDPLICVVINVIDGLWGSCLHISDQVVRNGRYGILERFMQTPSHHRAHHAKNVRYLDRNYKSITLFWDWVFGTLEPLRHDEPPEYGITRPVDTDSFWDVHFREFVLLANDIRGAATWSDKLGYIWKPPGWIPGDESQTAASRRRALDQSSVAHQVS